MKNFFWNKKNKLQSEKEQVLGALETLKMNLEKAESLEAVNDIIKYVNPKRSELSPEDPKYIKTPDNNVGQWINLIMTEKSKDLPMLIEVQKAIIKKICDLIGKGANSSKFTKVKIDNVEDFIGLCSDYIKEKSVEEKKGLINALTLLHNIRSAIIGQEEYRSRSLNLTQSLTSDLSSQVVEETYEEKIDNLGLKDDLKKIPNTNSEKEQKKKSKNRIPKKRNLNKQQRKHLPLVELENEEIKAPEKYNQDTFIFIGEIPEESKEEFQTEEEDIRVENKSDLGVEITKDKKIYQELGNKEKASQNGNNLNLKVPGASPKKPEFKKENNGEHKYSQLLREYKESQGLIEKKSKEGNNSR